MSETAVRVDLRQATLSESAPMHETDDAVFLSLENPPPVRSLLRITVGEDARAFEVARVIEVIDESEPKRGCYGNFVELERLEEQKKVGSEHLQPGIGGGGVPAPVVIMNTSDMMLGEVGSDEDEAAAAADADGDGGSDAAEGDGDAAEGDGGDAAEGDADSGSDTDAEDDD